LHARKLRGGRAEAILGKNGTRTLPSHRHETALAPCTAKGRGSARVPPCGRAALSSGRQARCVTREDCDPPGSRNAARSLPAGRRQRGIGSAAPTGHPEVATIIEFGRTQGHPRHSPIRVPEDLRVIPHLSDAQYRCSAPRLVRDRGLKCLRAEHYFPIAPSTSPRLSTSCQTK
jgi:hypothetical protein